MRRISNYFAH